MLKVNDLITVIFMNALAATSRVQYKIKEVHEDKDAVVIVEKGKRKRKVARISTFLEDNIVLKGYDENVFADSDGNYWHGNACYNLVSKMSNQELRDYLEENAIYPIKDSIKGSIVHYSFEQLRDHEEATIENVVYPELPSTGAPMTQIRNTEPKAV